MPHRRSQLLSILLHLAAIALLIAITGHLHTGLGPREPKRSPVRLVAPRNEDWRLASKRVGGGSQTESPPRRSEPPRRAHFTFVLPVARAVPEPKLVVASTIDAPMLNVPAALPGMPSGLLIGIGLGPGGSWGIGAGCCGGMGDHYGGGTIDGRAGQTTTRPVLIYKVEPEFSEEARKAKYEGMVLLSIEIGTNGEPVNLRVVRPLGMGLDEKAIEAVAKWRFKPALRAGKSVVSSALVEVHFHLL